ncbi:cytochrome c oxidase subunit VA-domain-containing protein [Naematelia encephala]|uniref:Cytochrome c oxidase subunit 6, mitochondrial n=1 Tax=Naematelia encephala TaxID=71784 RepID=A0A1Y2AR05_9TREE|nr:cytochrome c oxidase subunit VA-domain-containing protein [Naematelia encephala]
MIPSLSRVVRRAPIILRPAYTSVRLNSGGPGAHAHETESYEAFNSRYQQFFASCSDLFELQRGLNNCFAYDLVPSVEVIDAALKCARRVNDYATAVRILEGISVKVENKGQYKSYLEELKPVLSELGVSSKEELYGLKL